MHQFLISVDWGTSNFRLVLFNASRQKIVDSLNTEYGAKKLYARCKNSETSSKQVFFTYLKKQLKGIAQESLSNIPICISGMASSSIGIRELPYAKLPFDSTGEGLLIEEIKTDLVPNPVYLISGVCDQQDIMRGEEVQLIGLFAQNPGISTGIFILPGTHSKHIYCRDQRIQSFETFMTGELFELLQKHSLLANSIERKNFGAREKLAFERGIVLGNAGDKLLHHLFSIRARDLINNEIKSDAFYFLSGLLIGNELSSKSLRKSKEIYIVAKGQIQQLYLLAIKKLLPTHKIRVFPETQMEKAVPLGQLKISQRLLGYFEHKL